MLEDMKTCRATSFLAATWILMFVAMHAAQRLGITPSPSAEPKIFGFGQVSVETAHAFGAMRWPDLVAGQVWRVVTATFVHYSALHLLMNLVGLVQLGWLMEPWYGGRQFLAVNLAIGALGNLTGALMRQGFYQVRAWIEAGGYGRLLPEFFRNGGAPGQGVPVTTGGGSTIILGLIGMAMIVGWRSRTRVGEYLRDQMLGFLGYTALIGVVLVRMVDNYGHAGGALAGVAVGFLHRKLVRTEPKGLFRFVAGALATLVLIGCVAAQGRVGSAEIRRYREAVDAQHELETIARRLQSTAEFLGRLDALRLAMDQVARLREPVGMPFLDWPEGLTPWNRPEPGKPNPLGPAILTARTNLANVLRSFERARVGLDADLSAEPLDALLDNAGEALANPPSAKSLYAFEVDLVDLARRTRARYEELEARRVRLTDLVAGDRRVR